MNTETRKSGASMARRADRMTLASLWLVVVLVAFILGTPLIAGQESKLFPVVDRFEVTNMRSDERGVLISGVMRKQRDCAFVSLTVYAGSATDRSMARERLHVTFLDQPRDASTSREAGVQFWGPWLIQTPRSSAGPDLFMRVTHSCHNLWNTSGIYLVQPIETFFPKT